MSLCILVPTRDRLSTSILSLLCSTYHLCAPVWRVWTHWGLAQVDQPAARHAHALGWQRSGGNANVGNGTGHGNGSIVCACMHAHTHTHTVAVCDTGGRPVERRHATPSLSLLACSHLPRDTPSTPHLPPSPLGFLIRCVDISVSRSKRTRAHALT